MDRERIRRAALGKRAASADVTRAARRRMITYGLTVLLIGAWYLVERPGRGPPEPATEPLAPLDVPDTDREPRARVDRELLQRSVRDGTRAERALLEPEARLHLLEQSGRLVYGDLDKLGLDAGDHAALLADPAAHRGDPVWALGRLQWTDEEVIDRLPTTRGELVDAEGRSWLFLVLSRPFQLEPDEVVYVSGFFLKVHDVLRPGGEVVSAPLLVGEELLRSSFRIEPVTELRAGLLDGLRDFDIEQASQPLEGPEYYEALSYVANAPEERLFPPEQPLEEVLPIEMLAEPETWRGQPLQTAGVLLYKRQAPLGPRGQNPLGVPLHWQLWVSDTRSGSAGTMLVICLAEPEVAERDIVDVRGIFYRRLAFETRAKEAKMAAVVLARDVTTFVPPEDAVTPVIMKVIVGLVGGVVLLLALGQWRERRAERVERGRRLARKRRMVAGTGATSRGEGQAGGADAARDDEAQASLGPAPGGHAAR